MEAHKVEAPIVEVRTQPAVLDCQKAFNALEPNQKLYAYYFTRAAWEGAKICYFQRSYESPLLLYLILKAFSKQVLSFTHHHPLKSNQTPKQLFESAQKTFGEDKAKKIFVYLAYFLSNCGNYRSFGDSKFIPDCSKKQFSDFFLSSSYWAANADQFKQLYSQIEEYIFNYQPPYYLINFSDLNGRSGYYSSNVTSQDAQKVKASLAKRGILNENTRLIKYADNYFEVRIASVTEKIVSYDCEVSDLKVDLVYGDFSPVLSALNQHLSKAKQYASNDHQRKMIDAYIEHFRDGCVNKHKESQIHWVADKGPIIETNIGFIESYLDPLKVRAEFEGMVSVVNKQESKLLNNLVEHAESIIKQLPWGSAFELPEFKKPDFTSLEVLAFACSGIPVGINIPNYDEIREKHGFKNVNLGNAYGKPTREKIQYVPESEVDRHLKYYNPSLFLIVALHELLGHGTGKLFNKVPDEGFVNPLGYKIDTFYKQGQTWHSVFGDIASGYEECRADAVALYLSTYKNVREVLLPSYSDVEARQIMHLAWEDIIIGAIKGLQYYDVETDKWTQAHIAASFAIFSVLRKHGGVFEIRETERNGEPYLELIVHKDKIETEGKAAIGDFLKHLQIYKSTADVKRGEAFFREYLKVDETLLKYRNIVIKNKRPRSYDIQPEVVLAQGDKVEYRAFEESAVGAIESHLMHYRDSKEEILELWKENEPFKH